MDSDYLARIEDRMTRLQRKEIAMRQDVSQSNLELARSSADIELELEALKKELADLEHELHRTVVRLRMAVGLFKTVAKKGDFSRLQSRVDLWSPETRVTRTQFLRMLHGE